MKADTLALLAPFPWESDGVVHEMNAVGYGFMAVPRWAFETTCGELRVERGVEGLDLSKRRVDCLACLTGGWTASHNELFAFSRHKFTLKYT